jgi:TolB-like protein/tetratricopeptide (TPR) repeat protein
MNGTPPRDWNAIKAVFLEAVELSPDERDAFLARACGADTGLRSEVESLLAAHDDERPFLDAPAVAGAAHALSAEFDETQPTAARLQPGTRIGQYEVIERLGSGGMGEVYRAHDTKLDRFVALKIVGDSERGRTADRVLREARAASALNHPNICTLYEAGEFEGRPYLAMEYIAGQPLSSLIPSDGFKPGDVVKYGVQVADGLAHAHEHGVIHRDLKAANVVVTPQGRAKVLDFGVARRLTAVDVGVRTGTLTEAGTMSGTLAYIAPERLRDQPADARSDIWALGVLLYEMASGRRPFTGDTTFEVSSAILKDPPPPLAAKVPAQLRAVILKCLEREPARRFQQALDVVAALETHEHARRVDLRSIWSGRGVAVGLTVAALLVAAFAVYQWRRHGAGNGFDVPTVTLAVLPFKVLSGAKDIGFLGAGVPDAIISRVALVRTIQVKSALVPGKEDDDPQVAGRGLGVEYVLNGMIQKDNERIRITPRLVRIEDGVAIWTPSYTLPSTDLLRLQDEISRGVVDALPVHMTAADRARVEAQYTRNAEAYAAYVRGRAELVENKEPSVRAAVAHFQEALERDRDFVLAHAGLAMASARMRLFFAPEDEVRAWENRARDAANRALQLDGELAQSHEALAAFFRSAEFDWRATITEASRALERNPTLDQSHSFLASAYMHLGLLDRGSSEARLVMDLNQANLEEPLRIQGASAMYAGRYDEAVTLLKRASDASTSPAEWNLAYASYYAGRQAEAEDMMRKVRGKSARTQRRAQATLASFLAARGETEEAKRLIHGILAGTYMDHHVAYSLGAAFAQLDMPDEAVRWLSQSRKDGFPCYPWFERDPLLVKLKQRPAFQVFLGDLKQAWDTTNQQYPADR